jgi:hypothetical protein
VLGNSVGWASFFFSRGLNGILATDMRMLLHILLQYNTGRNAVQSSYHEELSYSEWFK